jgi:Uma2 family endonuclease
VPVRYDGKRMVAPGKVWTYDDLQRLPEDGNRYEIIDGELFVSPSPSLAHQGVVTHIVVQLYRALQETGLARVFAAPLDVILSPTRVVEPDVLVVRTERAGVMAERGIEGPVDLAVEVLSSSSIRTDREIKRKLYAAVGVPEYWIVDPMMRTIDVHALVDGDLQVVASYGPGERLESATFDLELDVDAVFR